MAQGRDIEGVAVAFRLQAPWYRSFGNRPVRGAHNPSPAPAPRPAAAAATLAVLQGAAASAHVAPPAPDPAAGRPAAAGGFRLVEQSLGLASSTAPVPGMSGQAGLVAMPARPTPCPPGRMPLLAAAFAPARPTPALSSAGPGQA